MSFTIANKEDLLYIVLADMYSGDIYITTNHVGAFGIVIDNQFKGYITFNAMDKTHYDIPKYIALIKTVVEGK